MSGQEKEGFESCAITPRCDSFAIGVCASCGRPTCDRHGSQVSGQDFLYFTLCDQCSAIPGRYKQLQEQKFGARNHEETHHTHLVPDSEHPRK